MPINIEGLLYDGTIRDLIGYTRTHVRVGIGRAAHRWQACISSTLNHQPSFNLSLVYSLTSRLGHGAAELL